MTKLSSLLLTICFAGSISLAYGEGEAPTPPACPNKFPKVSIASIEEKFPAPKETKYPLFDSTFSSNCVLIKYLGEWRNISKSDWRMKFIRDAFAKTKDPSIAERFQKETLVELEDKQQIWMPVESSLTENIRDTTNVNEYLYFDVYHLGVFRVRDVQRIYVVTRVHE